MGRAARDHVCRYDLANAVEATWSIYRDVIASARIRAAS
jgi:hypothetical protein